jgi:hypothetical protein
MTDDGPTDGPGSGSPGSGSPGSGSLAEELARLAQAAQEWLRDAAAASAPVDSTGPCRYCPVCQLVAALRDGHPELAERVGEFGAALLAAVHTAFDTATAPPGTSRSPVQHIRVDGQENR